MGEDRNPDPLSERPPSQNTVAVISLALGLISLPLAILILPAVLAIAFGLQGVSNAKRGDPHMGLAEWGLALGSSVSPSMFLSSCLRVRGEKHREPAPHGEPAVSVACRSPYGPAVVRRVSPKAGSVRVVSPSLTVADCPECRGVRTVILGICEVCFAEFIEDPETSAMAGRAPSSPSSPAKDQVRIPRRG
jgi:hypothetical protein